MTDETLADRAARVRRRFKTGRLDSMGRGFWEHWRPGDSSFLVGMYSAVILLLLEPSLWMNDWPEALISFRIPGWVALSLLLILPFNAWFLDRFLSSKTPGEDTLPRWLLGLRFLALSPPLLSFHTISLWKKFLERRASVEQPVPSRAARLDLSRSRWRLASGLQWRVLYRSGFLFVWMAVCLVPLVIWAVWLAGAPWLGRWHRPLILGACVFLHLVSSVSMALHFQLEIQKASIIGWRKTLLLMAPLFWLFALPGMGVGFAMFLLGKPTDGSLSWKLHASRTGVNRDPLWQGLQEDLRKEWQTRPWFTHWRRPTGLSLSKESGRKDTEIVALYRLKTLLLVLESLSLAVLVPWTPAYREAVLWAAAILAGTGMAIQIVGLLARLFRVSRLGESLNRHPYGRYLLLTQTAFLAGIYGGTILRQTSLEQIGFLLCLSAALCAVMTVIFLLLPTGASPRGPDMALWGLLYLALAALGGLIALQGEAWRASLLSFLRVSAVLSPLWSICLFLAFGGWLLSPFSWRHVFDRRLPRRSRTVLGFMAVSSVIPLGGLVVPFWIYVRHRLWPGYESFLRDHPPI